MRRDYERTKQVILRSVSSLDVARWKGLPVNKYGRMNVCPICRHDGHGGFVANPKDDNHSGGYYCYYQHHGGNVIDFLMNLDGFTYAEAVNMLIRTFNLNIPELSELSPAEEEEALRVQRMRNAFLVLYELGVKLFSKVMRGGQIENVVESNDYLDNIISMLEKID